MKSPIELYQQAYHLHFREGKPDLAKELYRQIIEQYPDSDERKYAQFLLARLSPVMENTPHAPSASFSFFAAVSFFISFLAAAGIVGLFFLHRLDEKSNAYMEKIILATHTTQMENYDQALLFLREAKLIDPDREAAYSLASEIYFKKERYDLAKAEYKALLSVSPSNLYAQERLDLIEQREKDAQAKVAEKQKEAQQPQIPPPQPAPGTSKAPALPPEEEPLKEAPSKNIDKSDVTYF